MMQPKYLQDYWRESYAPDLVAVKAAEKLPAREEKPPRERSSS